MRFFIEKHDLTTRVSVKKRKIIRQKIMDPGDHITYLKVHALQDSLSWCFFSFFSCVGNRNCCICDGCKTQTSTQIPTGLVAIAGIIVVAVTPFHQDLRYQRYRVQTMAAPTCTVT
jgi:hypothetical protein